MSGVFVDVSQDGHLKPWTRHKLRSITTSTAWFSFDHKRLLLPEELFKVLGFNANTSNMSASALSDLLGEAIAPPCLGILLMSILTAIPGFWTRDLEEGVCE
eukprot:2477218-Amphidinium_carterae.1